MATSAVTREIMEEVEGLPPPLQEQVLLHARALRQPLSPGTPGRELIRFAGTISREDLAQMSQAIEAACETVEPDEW